MFGAACGTGRGLQGPGLLLGGGSGQGTVPGQAGGSRSCCGRQTQGSSVGGGWAGVGGQHVGRRPREVPLGFRTRQLGRGAVVRGGAGGRKGLGISRPLFAVIMVQA